MEHGTLSHSNVTIISEEWSGLIWFAVNEERRLYIQVEEIDQLAELLQKTKEHIEHNHPSSLIKHVLEEHGYLTNDVVPGRILAALMNAGWIK